MVQGTCQHHDNMVNSKTFWTVIGFLVSAFGTIVLWSNSTSASADRVNGIEKRSNDLRTMVSEGFAKQDRQNEKVQELLTDILRAARK